MFYHLRINLEPRLDAESGAAAAGAAVAGDEGGEAGGQGGDAGSAGAGEAGGQAGSGESGQAAAADGAGAQAGTGTKEGQAGTSQGGGESLFGAFATGGQAGNRELQQSGQVNLPQDIQAKLDRIDKLEQWYQDTRELVGPALAAVKNPPAAPDLPGNQGEPQFFSKFDPEKQPEMYMADLIEQRATHNAEQKFQEMLEKRFGSFEKAQEAKEKTREEAIQRDNALNASLETLAADPKIGGTFEKLWPRINKMVQATPELRQLPPEKFATSVFLQAFALELLTNPEFARGQAGGFSGDGRAGANANLAGALSADGGAGGRGGGNPAGAAGGTAAERDRSNFIGEMRNEGNKVRTFLESL